MSVTSGATIAAMRPLLRRVPKLHRLAVFDAVASTGDFTAAAKQLEISQPAVSRHMRSLAEELGVELFARTGRTLTLTANGRRLADGVATALSTLERTVIDLDEDPAAFVMAVQPAMATSWVVPLLDQLEAVAGVDIQLRIFEGSDELQATEWDLAIVPGAGGGPAWESNLLFREAVRPFAAASLATELGLDGESPADALVHAPLLHIDDAGRPNMTWREWFAHAGGSAVPAKPRLLYNSYSTVVQEALAGNGIALGWQHLLSDMVERGLLVPVGPVVQRHHGGHHVCWPIGQGDDRHQAILDRLHLEVAESNTSFA